MATLELNSVGSLIDEDLSSKILEHGDDLDELRGVEYFEQPKIFFCGCHSIL